MDNNIVSQEEMENLKSITAQVRLFKGTGQDLVDICGNSSDIAKILAHAMDKTPSFYEAVKEAVIRHGLMQNPFTRLILMAKDASECECDKCVARRANVERAAKEN